MLAVLVMTACATTSGVEYCQPFVLSPVVQKHECFALSQPNMARWIGEHPAYRVKEFTCAKPEEVSALLGRDQA
jgi:hypothetical protein